MADRPKTVRQNPGLKRAYDIHDEYLTALREWERWRDENANKLMLWSIIRDTLVTAREEDWESDSDLPGYTDLRDAMDVGASWDALFESGSFSPTSDTPLRDLEAAHDGGSENAGASASKFVRFTRTIAAKRARVERTATSLRLHLQAGTSYQSSGGANLYVAYRPTGKASFLAEFMELDYGLQVEILSKLTFRLSSSNNGLDLLTDLLKIEEPPLCLLWCFDPPASGDYPVETVTGSGSEAKVTQLVINGPRDASLFAGGHVTTFDATSQHLLALGYNVLPAAASLYLDDADPSNGTWALGTVLGAFTDESKLDSAAVTTLHELQAGSVGALSNAKGLADAVGKTADIAESFGLLPDTKGFAVFNMFNAQAALLVMLFDDEPADAGTGLEVIKESVGLTSGIEDAVDLWRGKTVVEGKAAYEWAGFPDRLSSLMEFAGPLADTIDVTMNVASAIQNFASGDTSQAYLNCVAGVGGMMILVNSIASFGLTAGMAMPWLFGVGVALTLVAAVGSMFFGTTAIEAWVEHTWFGTKYGQGTKSVDSPYYRYDYEYEKANPGAYEHPADRKYAHQLSGYYTTTIPMGAYVTLTQDYGMTATIKKEAARTSAYSGQVYVGELKIPLIMGKKSSTMLLRPMVKDESPVVKLLSGYNGLTGPILHEFLLGRKGNQDPGDGLVEVPYDIDGAAAMASWNAQLNPLAGEEIYSILVRFESDDPRRVFGFSESELQSVTPYLVVQHAPPHLSTVVDRHLQSVGVSGDDRSAVYDSLPVLPTKRIPITSEL